MPILTESRQRELVMLLQQLGFENTGDVNWPLLDLALSHPSLDRHHNNDRLEFFGDSVLRLIVAAFLYESYPELSVGELSAIRADLVSDAYLKTLAEAYNFEQIIAVGASARQDPTGLTRRLADAVEAVLGALYLSWPTDGISRLRQWLDPHFQQRTRDILQDPARHNAKAALQELTQRIWGRLPEYRLVKSQSHPPWFEMEVWGLGQRWGSGQGRSKKAAEMAAARIAFKALSKSPPILGASKSDVSKSDVSKSDVSESDVSELDASKSAAPASVKDPT